KDLVVVVGQGAGGDDLDVVEARAVGDGDEGEAAAGLGVAPGADPPLDGDSLPDGGFEGLGHALDRHSGGSCEAGLLAGATWISGSEWCAPKAVHRGHGGCTEDTEGEGWAYANSGAVSKCERRRETTRPMRARSPLHFAFFALRLFSAGS